MLVVGWILMGAGVGIVAKVVLPGRDPNSALVPPILGVMGAVIGGVAGGGRAGIAILGAFVLVAVYAVSTGRAIALPRP
ncbi:MAG TPA: GlsB/YeaQ/YmgE family stress response membrane protein [Thermoanaerobaculia bacterium]|jgi:uncharacterized membrane protein YeaQ/YmgE (transglycosylase-associated protein family)|nr:GlsB/YeaQ/YmgE family stress response membrane protein [Thermoanaerobaculia bacterium]